MVAYNCKNVKTSVTCINELFKTAQLVLLSETWLYEYELYLLNEIGSNICSAGKCSDLYNPVPPGQRNRGHAGVAVLWRKEINHLITELPDGNERLQCLELALEHTKYLIVAAYLPTTGGLETETEFLECVDILREIILQYQNISFSS